MVSDKLFTADGASQIYTVDFAIISDNHCNVFSDGVLQSRNTYDIINNAVVFNIAPSAGTVLNIQVGTTPDDLLTTPTAAGIVATDITNVNTVATNITNVNTAASNIANINIVGSDLSEFGPSEIDIVATNIASVTSVAGNTTNINAVNANTANITILGEDVDNAYTLGYTEPALTAVADEMMAIIVDLAPIDQVLYDLIISTVDGYQRGDINNDGGISISDPIAVLRFILDLEDSSWIRTNILAPMIADTATYGTYFDSAILTVAIDIDDVKTTAADIDNVNTVAGISTDITTVAGISTDVTTVAANEASVNRYSDEYTISVLAPALPNEGDLWADTTSNVLKYYNGTSWEAVTSTSLIDDTTPQLGGDLDLNGHVITGLSTNPTMGGDLSGTASNAQIVVNAVTDTELNSAKLNNIEALADVTNTANVVEALSAGTGISISAAGEVAVTSLALTTVQTAVSQVAQLALTAQEGDVVVRSDENKSYVHNGGVAGTMADYTLLATPTDAVLSVGGNTGAVTAAQLKTSYESNANTNAYTDAEKTQAALQTNTNTGDNAGVTSVATSGAILGGTITGTGTISHSTAAGNKHVPTAGTVGQVLTNTASGTGTWQDSAGGGGINLTSATTAPASPSAGDQWFDTTNGILYAYMTDGTDSQWLDISSTLALGTTSSTALAGNTAYSTLALGTTSSTALAGNTAYSTLALGTTSSTAMAGNTPILQVETVASLPAAPVAGILYLVTT